MANEGPNVISMIESMIHGRNQFLNSWTMRALPYEQRSNMVSRYMTNELIFLEFINRVYVNDIQTQLAANALITFALPNNFLQPVNITASHTQINNSLEDFPNATSSCAICQDVISSTGCRIRQCGHAYHRACIVNWLSMSVRCPVCRHDIREASPEVQTSSALA
jgi:hypothetical protein